MNTKQHLEKFRPDELLVYKKGNWLVTVRTKQVTFGSMVVLPERLASSFADITADEAADLIQIFALLEDLSTTTLGAEKINIVAAMMKDPFVHFHFFPRYSQPKNALEHKWIDEDWPRAITLRDVDTPPEVLIALRDLIGKSLATE